jgi:hypothetical protein
LIELKESRHYVAAWCVRWAEETDFQCVVYRENREAPDAFYMRYQYRKKLPEDQSLSQYGNPGDVMVKRYQMRLLGKPLEAVIGVAELVVNQFLRAYHAQFYDRLIIDGDHQRFKAVLQEEQVTWFKPLDYEEPIEDSVLSAPKIDRSADDLKPGEESTPMPAFMNQFLEE